MIPCVFGGTSTVNNIESGDPDGECEAYFPNDFPEKDTRVLKCEDEYGKGGDDGENEIAEITEADGCQITCTDPYNSDRQYTLQAYGIVDILDKGNDKINQIDIHVNYKDSEGNSQELYATHIEENYYGDEYIGRGVVAYFGNEVPKKSLVFNTDPMYGTYIIYDDYYYKSVYYKYPSAIWPLFYSSELVFKLNVKDIYASYQHRLDFSNCQNTFLEFYFCGTDGYDDICPYDGNTAFLACYMHDDVNGNKAIISVDSEGAFVGEW